MDGPFGIHKEEGVDDEDSTFFIKPDRAPSPGQSEVLFLVIELISRIKDFLEPKERRANYISEILGAFSAGSVSSDNPELVKSAITQIEQRFAQEHLANQIKSKIAKSLLVLAGFAAVSIALASTTLSGSASAADQGLSTKMIDQDWRIAIGFGILIGTARSQFVDRIKNLANNAK